MKVRLLDADTINKIAAGEIVERPASAVKELVENSIDAGASRILIEVEDGGKTLIRVVDDGCGMDREDALMAFSRHATSKISGADDLTRIHTLGFRGEALAAIASVAAQVDVHTKPKQAEAGTFLRIVDGSVASVKDAGCPAGTSMAVRDLFRNVPARRKHLSSASSELSRVVETVTSAAIIHPEISFELFTGKRTLFRSVRSASWDQVLVSAFGLDVARGFHEVVGEGPGLAIRGVVCSPSSSRASPDWIHLYVNGRPIHSKALQGAVREAFRTLLPLGREPIAVISLDVNPEEVDVNVHPAKREVRFLHEEIICQLLKDAVVAALGAMGPTAVPVRTGTPQSESMDLSAQQKLLPMEVSQSDQPVKVRLGAADDDSLKTAKPVTGGRQSRQLRILGQALDLYIIAEDGQELVLIDQHAAAERVAYESLQRRFAEGSMSQELLEPIMLELSAREEMLLESWLDRLKDVGFEIVPFGGRSFMVRSVPATAPRLDRPEGVREVLLDILAQGKPQRSSSQDDLLKMLACRRSIKSGRRLNPEEMRRLLDDLLRCRNPRACPHGRPTMVAVDWQELERMFHRR
ncbi:MAG: DNA mismatch repair protein [Methanosaeta sp. PtaU1.Bin028]|nr:MAG: DNA mismatch repair protein [Methanosaeta sp. PtaU1.Bin028]